MGGVKLQIGHLVPAFALRIEFGGNIVISQPVHEDRYITSGRMYDSHYPDKSPAMLIAIP